MKGYETQTALRAIGEAISAHEKQIKQHGFTVESSGVKRPKYKIGS